MLRLNFRSVLVSVVWVYFITGAQCFANFHKEESNRGLNDCERRCQDSVSTEPSSVNEHDSRLSSCLEKCLSLNEATESENDGATTSTPGTRSTSELLNSADPSTTTSSSENVCPYGDKYAPNSDEIEPGNVKEVEVDFVKIEEGDSQEWVARVNWTRPKDVNITSNWLGYIVIWYTEGPDNSDEIFGNTSCKLVPKTRPHLDISETDGWKYPNTLYLTVVALPTNKLEFPLEDYTPLRTGWRNVKVYSPANYSEGNKIFEEKSFLMILAGVLTGFSLILIVYICVTRRKACTRGKLVLTTEKKAREKEDELKSDLFVIQNPCSDVKQFV